MYAKTQSTSFAFMFIFPFSGVECVGICEMSLFSFDKVTKRYHYTKANLFTDLSFKIDFGEKVTLLMQTQSGKTTVAKLLTGITKANGGQILFKGENYKTAPKDKGIAFLCAEPILFERKSVLYNLTYPLLIRKIDETTAYNTACQTATAYGFADTETKVKSLSVEMRFMLSVARASQRQLSLVIADSLSDSQLHLATDLADKQQCALLILTDDGKQAAGKTYVVYNESVEFCGTADQAREFISQRLWLNQEYIDGIPSKIETLSNQKKHSEEKKNEE